MKVAILGCGYMGTALLLGLLKRGDRKYTYAAHVTSSASAQRIKSELADLAQGRVEITYGDDTAADAIRNADVVFLCVQPKDLRPLLSNGALADVLRLSTLVSTLAGVSVEQIEAEMGFELAQPTRPTIARIIPTLGAIRGDSVTLLADPGKRTDLTWFQLVEELLVQVGSIVRVPEALMNSATAIGAAVHALAIVAVDAATDASVAAGMPRDVARAIAAESLRSGSGLMCGEGSMTAEQVKAAMSTPGGITLNAVVNLDAGARPGIASAVKAAVAYTNRMSG